MAKNVIKYGFQAGAGGFVARDNAGVGEMSLDDTNFVTTTELNTLDGLTSSTAELNKLDGANVTTTEINNGLDASARVVSLTEATTLTPTTHGNGKYVTLDLLAGFDTTLPAATGTGNTYHLAVGTVRTSNDYGILVTTTDIMQGSVVIIDTDTVADSETGFATAATSDSLTMNATTKGGLTIGDWVKFIDVASGVWHVTGQLTGSGTIVTPFAAEVS